ncbi:hypothetical protein JCM11251_004947 [Rhodosporidiobolus azoricus]
MTTSMRRRLFAFLYLLIFVVFLDPALGAEQQQAVPAQPVSVHQGSQARSPRLHRFPRSLGSLHSLPLHPDQRAEEKSAWRRDMVVKQSGGHAVAGGRGLLQIGGQAESGGRDFFSSTSEAPFTRSTGSSREAQVMETRMRAAARMSTRSEAQNGKTLSTRVSKEAERSGFSSATSSLSTTPAASSSSSTSADVKSTSTAVPAAPASSLTVAVVPSNNDVVSSMSTFLSSSGDLTSSFSSGSSASSSPVNTATTPTVSPSAKAEAASSSASTFVLPGRSLAVLPIGLGIFGGVAAIALIIVALVTYERHRYRAQFRTRRRAQEERQQREQVLATAGAIGEYGGAHGATASGMSGAGMVSDPRV